MVHPKLSAGAHPLACDALALPTFDHTKPERIQSREGGLMTSAMLDGGSGPLLSVSSGGATEYVGSERVTTRVGTFEAHHYRFPSRPGRTLHPSGTPLSEDIWVTHPDYTQRRARRLHRDPVRTERLSGILPSRRRLIRNYRNHATHGRPLPHEVIDQVVEAVAALDELHTAFEPASAGVGH